METNGGLWAQLQRRYTYRIPTAIVCTIAMLVVTGIWAITDDRDPQRVSSGGDVAAGEFGTDDGTSTTAPGTGADGVEAGAPVDADGDGTPDTTAAPAGGGGGGGAGAPAGGGGGEAGGGQTGAAGGGGGGGGGAPAGSACPEGLDKGDCVGVTDKAVRVGSHAAETQCGTPLPDTTDEREAEASDWVRYINEVEGGVHGRLLELYEADDGYCTEMAGQAATKLIDQDRVFTVQGFLGADQNRVMAEKAQSRGVPYLAGGGPAEWAGRWQVFHQNQSSYDVMYAALLKYIIGGAGLNKPDAKIGMMYVDTPDVRDPWNRAKQRVPQANVVAAIPLAQGIKQNFLEEIRQMQAAGADTVFCNCHPLNMVSFVQQADAQQFKPQYTFVSQGADLDIVLRLFPGDSTWAKNAKGLSNFCHPSHPCSKPFEEKLRKIRPDVIMSQLSLIGIHAIELWAEPMRRVGPELSRGRYTQALRGLEGFTTGLSAPIDLAPDRSVGLTGFAVYQSPGPGSRNYQMVDAAGQAFRGDW